MILRNIRVEEDLVDQLLRMRNSADNAEPLLSCDPCRAQRVFHDA